MNSFSDKQFKPPVFLDACPRSGSTLLVNILGKHKNLYSIHCSNVFIRHQVRDLDLYEKIVKQKNYTKLILSILTAMFEGGRYVPLLVNEKFSEEAYKYCEEIKKLEDFHNIKTKYDALDLCARYMAFVNGKNRWVDRAHGNLFYSDKIFSLYPKAKFVQIYRDPRALTLSIMEKRKRYDRLVDGIFLWNRHQKKLLEKSNVMKDTLFSVKYEELIDAPEAVLRNLCDFLEEDFDPTMLEVSEYGSSFSDLKNQTGFSAAPISRWQNKLTKNQILLIDLLTGKLRKQYGYHDHKVEVSIFSRVVLIFYALKEALVFLFYKLNNVFTSYRQWFTYQVLDRI